VAANASRIPSSSHPLVIAVWLDGTALKIDEWRAPTWEWE